MVEQIPKKLYHYCSVDTFRIIAEMRTLRLSEMTKSNDSMECVWMQKKVIPDLLEEGLLGLLDKENPNMATSAKSFIIDRFLKIYSFYLNDNQGLFTQLILASCFSQKADLLSQWRGYADDGQGISIGFGSSLFKEFQSSDISAMSNIRKVIYDRRAQTRSIGKETADLLYTISAQALLSGAPILTDAGETHCAFVELVSKALLISANMKNQAFKEEHEWRLYTIFYGAGIFGNLQSQFDRLRSRIPVKQLQTITRDNKISFYTDIDLIRVPHNGALIPWIREVIIGPKCRLSERDIRLVLDCYGWDTSALTVKKSEATYV